MIDWGVASRPLAGEVVQGDHCFVGCDASQALVVVVDALGHGLEAARAAELAIDTVSRHAQEPVARIFEHCHQALRRTRGAAMSAASFRADDGTLTWLGIGNVEGVVIRKRVVPAETRSLVVRGGVVGYQLPALRPSSVTLSPGDTLVMATDGVKLDFMTDLAHLENDAQGAADYLLRRHGKTSDDALVLIARYLGVRS